jgi:hypothetical protein
MTKYVTIGYGDPADYDTTPQEIRDAAHAHDARLRAGGAVMGVAGRPIQVSNHGAAGVTTTDGPYMNAELPVAGFALIEAGSLEEAIELVSATPCAVAHGVVEVWPLEE